MSDATWDMEYSNAKDIKNEIKHFCQERGIEVPNLEKIKRSWDLEVVLEKLKNEHSTNKLKMNEKCKEMINYENITRD